MSIPNRHNQQYQFPNAPVFAMAHGGGEAHASNSLSLDDIFDEFLFANELKDASKNMPSNNSEQQGSRDDYGDDESFDEDNDGDGMDEGVDSKKKKRHRVDRGMQQQQRFMTEEQKVERRYYFFF